MKNNNITSFIIISGFLVLVVFTLVINFNLLPSKESNSYYLKVGDNMSAKIESVHIDNGKLIINTSGDTIEYCVKSTKSKPSLNAVCWNKIENNMASISIFQGKRYYIWIKDETNNISNYLTVNTNDKNLKN